MFGAAKRMIRAALRRFGYEPAKSSSPQAEDKAAGRASDTMPPCGGSVSEIPPTPSHIDSDTILELPTGQGLSINAGATSSQPKYLGPGINGRFIKPLTKAAEYPEQAEPVTHEAIKQWRHSSKFDIVHEYFREYPANSLMMGIGRELLYHMVRSTKPEVVIEVGTYYAGTSETIVRALSENGKGMLHTTDPYGVERCPAIIAEWPEPLRQHIKFYPLNSMDFFIELEQRGTMIDMALIDGNHDYQYACFDLASAAKMMRPGGIVVLDNIEQPGPFWAGVDFLKRNPEWTEIGDSISDFTPTKPFDSERCFIDGTPFLILKAPNEYVVKSMPMATGQVRYVADQLSGVRMQMTQRAPRGVLHAQLFLRGFSNGQDPEQLVARAELPLNGESSSEIKLPKALRTRFSTMGIEHYHTVEIVLFWQPEGHEEPLRLDTVPTPFA